MDGPSEKDEPRFPQEIINIILRHVKYRPFLWTTCRNVSHAFREEVDLIFEKTLLRETTIMWPRDQLNWADFFNCRLSRLSDDGQTAYFTVYSSWHASETRASLGDEEPAAFRELEGLITAHISKSTTSAYTDLLRVVTRIGADTNNTHFTDAPIPSVVLHRATSEISLDWRALFSTVFHELQYLRLFKIALGCIYPHMQHLNIDHPIVLSSRDFSRGAEVDLVPCVDLLYHRAVQLGWFPKGDLFNLPRSDIKRMIVSVDRLDQFTHDTRLEEIFERVEGQFADCRGSTCFVEKPAQNGWTRNHNTRRAWDWYNHAWEDPRDRGRTTWSDDPLVIEVEAIARAWEKGLA